MFSFHSIEQYHIGLQNGSASCASAVSHYLARIKQFEHLNAFVSVYGDESLRKAEALDRQRRSGQTMGRLHGVVIGIKDVICYQDHPLSAASKFLEGFISLYHATVVERLIREEAIIIGHTNCDEFAMGSSNENSTYGPVRNALDESKVPGGSSGGSAVAVQAGLCMVSLGSDTGGSVRQPAGFCGIIGLKPTYGRISRSGLVAYGSSLDQIGIFSLGIPDIAQVLEVVAGSDTADATCSAQAVPRYADPGHLQAGGTYKIAFLRQALEHPSLDPEIGSACAGLIKKLQHDGHRVELIDFNLLDFIAPAYYILSTAEASSNLARYDGVKYGIRSKETAHDLSAFYMHNRSAGFGREVKRRILMGVFVLSAGYYDHYYTRAQQVRQQLIDYTNLIFNTFDVICLPVSPTTAFPLGEKKDDPISMYLADIYTVYANLAGIPAISIPLFGHSSGMPFGIQAMTNQFKELPLLQFSHRLMQQYKSYENPTL